MLGGEPLAAQHQQQWMRHGRRYHVRSRDGRSVDRQTAVETIYPRFLYIFSDVVCYVTRNHRAWANSAIRLLEWSKAGVENTINQHALPALIIVLNAPDLEAESSWLGENSDAVTDEFFKAVEDEIRQNSRLKELSKKVSYPIYVKLNPRLLQ